MKKLFLLIGIVSLGLGAVVTGPAKTSSEPICHDKYWQLLFHCDVFTAELPFFEGPGHRTDFDGDGDLDIDDIDLIASEVITYRYLSITPLPENLEKFDLQLDGVLDYQDVYRALVFHGEILFHADPPEPHIDLLPTDTGHFQTTTEGQTTGEFIGIPDGELNMYDVARLFEALASFDNGNPVYTLGHPSPYSAGDFNLDGIINWDDHDIVVDAYDIRYPNP